ncbi:hypothetical protein CUC08_Gglean001500 [Alternaria sp. MG1]|jgi:hypothetical protein|nr:hypothetical protein CUC08_Gglean001500 [Alternaria sp. MG1]
MGDILFSFDRWRALDWRSRSDDSLKRLDLAASMSRRLRCETWRGGASLPVVVVAASLVRAEKRGCRRTPADCRMAVDLKELSGAPGAASLAGDQSYRLFWLGTRSP